MEKEYLIKKWLNDTLTPEEQKAFEGLEEYGFFIDIIDNAKQFKVSDDLKVNDFEIFNQRIKTKSEKPERRLWTNPFLRIASVIIVALGLYFTVFRNESIQVKTLAHQKATIELPDKSEVILNALTDIEYNKRNWNNKRSINLKGEAFFKVQKGKTFDVVTSNGVVTVVGTQFSVKQRKNFFEVKCYQGIVKVTSNQISETLTAGKTYRILNDKFSQSEITEDKPQWLDNESSFENLPFREVVKELERQYNIEIKLENSNQNPIFTGGFVHNNLDNALMSITQPLNLTYKIISSKQVVIYGRKK